MSECVCFFYGNWILALFGNTHTHARTNLGKQFSHRSTLFKFNKKKKTDSVILVALLNLDSNFSVRWTKQKKNICVCGCADNVPALINNWMKIHSERICGSDKKKSANNLFCERSTGTNACVCFIRRLVQSTGYSLFQIPLKNLNSFIKQFHRFEIWDHFTYITTEKKRDCFRFINYKFN